MPRLALADFLSARGHAVTMIYGAPSAGRSPGKYLVGAPPGRLDARDVVIHCNQDVTRIGPDAIEVRKAYSERAETLGNFDSVVLACGSEAEARLYCALRASGAEVHVLGDAFAPRRLDFATKQVARAGGADIN